MTDTLSGTPELTWEYDWNWKCWRGFGYNKQKLYHITKSGKGFWRVWELQSGLYVRLDKIFNNPEDMMHWVDNTRNKERPK